MSKKEELLDELFDSLKSTAHYMTGILRDLAAEKYSLDEVGIDIEAIEEKAGAIVSILSEIRDLNFTGDLENDITEELPIMLSQPDAIWDHYAKAK